MANGLNGNGNLKMGQVVDYIFKFLIGVTTVLVVSIWSQIANIENRVTAIEASRFTTGDGIVLWREVEQRVTREELMARLDHIESMIQELREYHRP